jgi:hypothetical protein
MKKRYATLPFIFALGAGCYETEPEPGPGVSLDPECYDRFVERGRAVVASVAACETDADCVIACSSPGCLTPFLCSEAIAVGNDAAYEDAASALVDDYIAECGNFCAVADCVGPEQLRAACDTSIGQCSLVVLPFEGTSANP